MLARCLRTAARAIFHILVLSAAFAEPAPASAEAMPRLTTNEAYIDDVLATTSSLAIKDPMAVFAHVLGQLPDRVKVYPTENYYYFSFAHRHLRYAGNIRLDVTDRDLGKVHFAYFVEATEWGDDETINRIVLDQSNGVMVERTAPLVYRVTYGGKAVTFELNDLSDVKPPPHAIARGEIFIGPIFDESGIRFFLMYHTALKIFLYILDETVPVADSLRASSEADRILIGRRTGFAFYRDHQRPRKILIGVFEGNANVNNFFDGPFDQMPDNFIQGDTFREAILATAPSLKGKVDRFGNLPPGDDRFLIAPYHHYRNDEDLLSFHTCASDKLVPFVRYYLCFVWSDDDEDESPRFSPLYHHRIKAHRSPNPAPHPK